MTAYHGAFGAPMPEIRANINEQHRDRLDALQESFGYGQRGRFLEFAIDWLWCMSALSNDSKAIKTKAARILTQQKRWAVPLEAHEIVSVRVGDVVEVLVERIAEPYRIPLKLWDENNG